MAVLQLRQRVKVVRAIKPERSSLVGFVGVVERIATHAGITIYWVRMEEKLPEGLELHGPLEVRHRWVLMDPEEIEPCNSHVPS